MLKELAVASRDSLPVEYIECSLTQKVIAARWWDQPYLRSELPLPIVHPRSGNDGLMVVSGGEVRPDPQPCMPGRTKPQAVEAGR